jgi:transposase
MQQKVPERAGRNRAGDRHLNTALHTIALVRRREGPATRHQVTRRTQQCPNSRDIDRCPKRYLSRSLFRIMEATATMA